MASSRLPGKVLLPALGRPMLRHLVDRIRAVASVDSIVLATTTNPADDVLEVFARDSGIVCYRGSESDVLQRVVEACRVAAADLVVEITGDCPIIDPEIVEQTIRMFHANDAVYASNVQVRSYPDGMDVQVFELKTLEASSEMTRRPLDREHVTLFIRNHPELFPQVNLVAPPALHWPELGLTLDEPEDYALLQSIIEHFPEEPLFSCADAISLLRTRPQLLAINAGVHRKGDT